MVLLYAGSTCNEQLKPVWRHLISMYTVYKCIQDTLFIDCLKVIPNKFQNNRVVVNLNKYKIQSYHFDFSGRSCHVI